MRLALVFQGAQAPSLPQASSIAAQIDLLLGAALWLALFLVVLLSGGLVLLRCLPRATSDAAAPADASSSNTRVWLGALGALCAAGLFVFFALSARVWAALTVPPRVRGAIAILPTAEGWSFTYPNGVQRDELHLALGTPTRLELQPADFAYRWCAPAFRLQYAVEPGARRSLWVEATLPGEYSAFDPERPEQAPALVVVQEASAFDEWYRSISGPSLDLPPIELGRASYQMRGCTQCHTLDGTPSVGPSFQSFSKRLHSFADGSSLQPDADYVRESLLEPPLKVVAGFEPVMPSFRGRLQEQEIAGLAAFLESLP